MEEKACPFCPDGHEHPLTHPWSVQIGPQRDGDGQPTHLIVAKTGLQHVAESDADWLWKLIRNARRD
jgi:hypothetical protein